MDNRRARCRCTIVAYLEGSDKGQRAARDDDGKYQRIPADMSYRDWKAVYIDKTKTLETWQAEFDARRQADEQSPLRQRGRQVIEDLAAGRDPRAASGGKVATDALTAVPSRGNVVVLTSPPQTVGKCKTFDELKMYWAENYNVKVDDSIAKLHFGSVQAAMNGVEAVLKEFPPAMRFLKEFGLHSGGLMTTVRGRGIIYFDPESFSNADNIISEIQAGIEKGFYPKNMSVFGVGAHEAGHIVEDWLIDKSGAPKDVNLRIVPRRIVSEAYASALKTIRASGRFKTSKELIGEICTHALKYNESECVADAIADYKINKENAALMSRNISQRLKKELE